MDVHRATLVPPGVDGTEARDAPGIRALDAAETLFRLGWRIAHRPPPLPAMAAWKSRLAVATHAGLYVALIVMPIAGYLGSVASGYPVKLFGITLPMWGTPSPVLKDAMSDVHLATSWVIVALTVLHVAGALHHVFRGDGIMSRMGFARRAARLPADATRVTASD